MLDSLPRFVAPFLDFPGIALIVGVVIAGIMLVYSSATRELWSRGATYFVVAVYFAGALITNAIGHAILAIRSEMQQHILSIRSGFEANPFLFLATASVISCVGLIGVIRLPINASVKGWFGVAVVFSSLLIAAFLVYVVNTIRGHD